MGYLLSTSRAYVWTSLQDPPARDFQGVSYSSRTVTLTAKAWGNLCSLLMVEET